MNNKTKRLLERTLLTEFDLMEERK